MTELDTYIDIGKLSDAPFIYENEDDYIFGKLATRRFIKTFFPDIFVSFKARNVVRKALEDVFFDVLRKADSIAKATHKRARIRDMHIVMLTDSSAIGYPVLINKQIKDMTNRAMENLKAVGIHAQKQEGSYWSDKSLYTIAVNSGIDPTPTRKAVGKLSDFLVKCTAYYLSNTMLLNSLIRKRKIRYDIAVAGKIATRLPNNTNDDIQREKIKEEIGSVKRRRFLTTERQKMYREHAKRLRDLKIIKTPRWRKNGNKNKPSGEKILSPA